MANNETKMDFHWIFGGSFDDDDDDKDNEVHEDYHLINIYVHTRAL